MSAPSARPEREVRERPGGDVEEGRPSLRVVCPEEPPLGASGHGCPDLPTVSVVLATRGRARLLAKVIGAVIDDPAVLEMIVVVDGEDDRPSLEVLGALAAHEPRLHIVTSARAGQLAALDRGVARARGQIVLLLDDDVVAQPGLATGHARRHLDQGNLVVAGAMPVRLSDDGRDPPGTVLYSEEYLSHVEKLELGQLDVLDALWTGNVSLRTDACRRVGLRSASFTASYHADTELGFRLRQHGLVGVYDGALAAVHLHRRDTTAFLNDARRQGAGRALLQRTYPGRAGRGTPESWTSDLPTLLGPAVRVIGSSRAGEPVARMVMAVGSVLGRLGGTRWPIGAARLARRLMLWRGATAGEPS
jgi:GT2 family glycosyltransferase